jgi:hypothetical protein
MNDQEIEAQMIEINRMIWKMIDDMIGDGMLPTAVAGTLVASALSIYKTILEPDDYDSMLKTIFETRGKVKSLMPTLN